MSKKSRHIVELIAIYVAIILITIIILFPFYVVLITTLKPLKEILLFPPSFIPQNPTIENIKRIIGMSRFLRYLFNSLFISLITTALSMFFGSFGGYALSRLRFTGQKIFSQMILLVYMFPAALLVIPLFLIMYSLNLVDTYYSLILSYTTFSLPFCVWMLKGFFDSIPSELGDAAMVDGCTHFQVLKKIALPISAPGLTAVAAFSFLLSWSEYIFSITFITTDKMRPLAAGIQTLMGQYVIDYGLVMAAALITIIPVLIFFLLLQKYIVQGITAGAVKG